MSFPSQRPAPIRMTVATRKANNNVDLAEILDVVATASSAAATEQGANAASPELATSLNKISQLATDLATELANSQKLDPTLDQRIQRVAPAVQRKFKAV
jgi:hypothetical protein